MNINEYEKISNYKYADYCQYLPTKHGFVGGDYFTLGFSQNMAIKRTSEGLYIHHIDEDKVANLIMMWQRQARLITKEQSDSYMLTSLNIFFSIFSSGSRTMVLALVAQR